MAIKIITALVLSFYCVGAIYMLLLNYLFYHQVCTFLYNVHFMVCHCKPLEELIKIIASFSAFIFLCRTQMKAVIELSITPSSLYICISCNLACFNRLWFAIANLLKMVAMVVEMNA